MKTKFLIIVSVVALLFFSLSSFNTFLDITDINVQDDLVLKGTYDGHEDYGYNFIYLDGEGEEKTFTFQDVKASVLEKFNLDDEALIKTKFKITYTTTVEKSIDEDGNESEDEINTIIKLEKQ
ncbi:hypothetical protein [Thalassobellus suaedae]|uniref:Uncharacterized protein n=1 Tax=Thalassobellus suaedae TaxID=3074124 RepID=A0ABY9XQN9_9FLAO|nr:hypothetical protein RHP51_13545 [Flavobacteriaceae bacterium HL-DH14]